MEPIEYAKWCGRFRVIVEALRERPGDLSNRLADEAIAEYDRVNERQRVVAHYAALAAEAKSAASR